MLMWFWPWQRRLREPGKVVEPGAGVRSVQFGPTPRLLGATMLRSKLIRLPLLVVPLGGYGTCLPRRSESIWDLCDYWEIG